MSKLVVGKIGILIAFIFGALVLVMPIHGYAVTESGSVGLEGRVVATPPGVAPVILQPKDQQHFEESPITVSGTCQNNLLIKIYINDVFSGSATCSNSKYSIVVNLYSGENKIIARGIDSLDQASPDSNTVTAFYDVVSSDLRLTTNYARRSANPKEKMSWPITISGGVSPYAISVNWGDGNTSIKSIANPGEFLIEHEYTNSGIYKVLVNAIDIEDNKAVLQLVAVSNGIIISQNMKTGSNSTKTVILWWPMTLFFIFIISTFWLGRRYERRLTNND